jgi:hypothetical protein
MKRGPEYFFVVYIYSTFAHSIAKNKYIWSGSKIYLNHADDLKNREKVKVTFFAMPLKIEA